MLKITTVLTFCVSWLRLVYNSYIVFLESWMFAKIHVYLLITYYLLTYNPDTHKFKFPHLRFRPPRKVFIWDWSFFWNPLMVHSRNLGKANSHVFVEEKKVKLIKNLVKNLGQTVNITKVTRIFVVFVLVSVLQNKQVLKE